MALISLLRKVAVAVVVAVKATVTMVAVAVAVVRVVALAVRAGLAQAAKMVKTVGMGTIPATVATVGMVARVTLEQGCPAKMDQPAAKPKPAFLR
jgi:hypothetical protein